MDEPKHTVIDEPVLCPFCEKEVHGDGVGIMRPVVIGVEVYHESCIGDALEEREEMYAEIGYLEERLAELEATSKTWATVFDENMFEIFFGISVLLSIVFGGAHFL